jgi:hypothetical protein
MRESIEEIEDIKIEKIRDRSGKTEIIHQTVKHEKT